MSKHSPNKQTSSAIGKPKDKKTTVHPPISASSLLLVPDDVVEGFQKRIETGVEWTVVEAGARHHRENASRASPHMNFTKSLKDRMQNGLLGGFFDKNSTLTMQERWELIVPIAVWDNDKSSNAGKICFNTANSITDDLVKIIKQAVISGGVKKLKQMLYDVKVLRVIDGKMTELDDGLLTYTKLTTLNLCGNKLTSINTSYLPPGLKILELQGNYINDLQNFPTPLPENLIYLGLSRNLLNNDGITTLNLLPRKIKVLDVSHNDIYYIEPVLTALANLPYLNSLLLIGNPCALSLAYARLTIHNLPRLEWLDAREILASDRVTDYEQLHEDTLYTYFTASVIRIMAVPQPPKTEKGWLATFHVELEIPLLDVQRRRFLMYRNNESLVELLPASINEESVIADTPAVMSNTVVEDEESGIYSRLVPKNSREVINYTKFESNRVQWNKIMTFQDPMLKIFCPDLKAVRDTFRSNITLRLIYTLLNTKKADTKMLKNSINIRVPGEQRLVLATIKCPLQQPNWSWPNQHFHWDDTFVTDTALHWGDGDLAILQYVQATDKPLKTKTETTYTKQILPLNLTCHFGFSIETLR